MKTLAVLAALACATIDATSPRVEFAPCSSCTTQFNFGFKAFSASEVKVYKNGVLQSTGYSVVFDSGTLPSTGKVVFSVAPADGVAVKIERTRALSQGSTWTSFSRAKSLEQDLDRLAMNDQQLQRDQADAIAAASASTAASAAATTAAAVATAASAAAVSSSADAAAAVAAAAVAGSSSLVTATGSTQPRTMAKRAADFVNAADFGSLTPDAESASTVNTATIQAAADYASSRCAEVFIPRGEFYINSTINMTHSGCGWGLAGAGRDSTILRWAGAATGKMIRFGGYYMYLHGLRLVSGYSRPTSENGVIGVWLYDSYYGHVQNAFVDVSFGYLSIGIKNERPNYLSGGQNEGGLVESVRFDICYTGILHDQHNVDYWSYVNTYWNYNHIAMRVSNHGMIFAHTWIGCVGTGMNTDSYSAFLSMDPTGDQGWGTLTFIDCQTEILRWTLDIMGLHTVVWIGGTSFLPARFDTFGGTVTQIGGIIGTTGWDGQTATTQLPYTYYDGNGVTTTFAFTARIEHVDAPTLGVWVDNAYTEGYVLSANANQSVAQGGTIAFPVAPLAGKKIQIIQSGYVNGLFVARSNVNISLQGVVVTNAAGARTSARAWAATGNAVPPASPATLATAISFRDEGSKQDQHFREAPVRFSQGGFSWANHAAVEAVASSATGAPAFRSYLADGTTVGFWVDFDGGAVLNPSGAQPSCTSAHRGKLWHVFSGAGVKDKVEVCTKDAADAYGWRTLY